MPQKSLKPGDLVIYCDQDHVSWGPWEVSDVSGDTVTVVVEDMISCPAKVTSLQRVQGIHEQVAVA
jgi:hypothetical protein